MIMAERVKRAGPPWRFILHVLLYNLRIFLILGAVAIVGVVYLAKSVGGPAALGAMGLIVLVGLALYGRAYRRAAVRDTIVTRRPVEDVFRLMATEFFENLDRRIAAAA